jgi:hypothetical protein
MQTQRAFRVLSADPEASTTADPAATDQAIPGGDQFNTPKPPIAPAGSKIGLAMLPITPVPFSGDGAIYAWGRLLAYSALAVMTYSKHKTASYVFAGAAGLSLVTSLAAKTWTDK